MFGWHRLLTNPKTRLCLRASAAVSLVGAGALALMHWRPQEAAEFRPSLQNGEFFLQLSASHSNEEVAEFVMQSIRRPVQSRTGLSLDAVGSAHLLKQVLLDVDRCNLLAQNRLLFRRRKAVLEVLDANGIVGQIQSKLLLDSLF